MIGNWHLHLHAENHEDIQRDAADVHVLRHLQHVTGLVVVHGTREHGPADERAAVVHRQPQLEQRRLAVVR